MIVSHIDPDSRSTITAAEGQHALNHGDTVLARQKFSEAGAILEAGAARTQSNPEKNLLRFLAASQFYHGGDYQRAKRIVARTKPKYLSAHDREQFEAFRKDVEERADAGYAERIRHSILTFREQGRPEMVIKLLKIHPYAFGRGPLAWLRGDSCSRIGRWRPAARFYGDAVRFSDRYATPVFLRPMRVIELCLDARPADAQVLADCSLDVEPTALDWVAAGAARLHRLLGGDLQAGTEISQLFRQAVSEFRNLPRETQADADVRAFFAHGYSLAAVAAERLGNRVQAVELATDGLEFDPDGPHASDFRTLIADPSLWFGRPADQIATTPTSLLGAFAKRTTAQDAFLRAA